MAIALASRAASEPREDRAKSSHSEEDKVAALIEAKINEQKAKDKKAILIKYTEVKNLKEIEAEVFKAKEEELKKEAVLVGEKSKAEKLRKEIGMNAGCCSDGRHHRLSTGSRGLEDTFEQGRGVVPDLPAAACRSPVPARLIRQGGSLR